MVYIAVFNEMIILTSEHHSPQSDKILGFLDAPDDGESYAIISDILLMTHLSISFFLPSRTFFKFIRSSSFSRVFPMPGPMQFQVNWALVFFEIIIFL